MKWIWTLSVIWGQGYSTTTLDPGTWRMAFQPQCKGRLENGPGLSVRSHTGTTRCLLTGQLALTHITRDILIWTQRTQVCIFCSTNAKFESKSCTGVEVFICSRVRCLFCFETSTTEGRGGGKGGSANSRREDTEPLSQEFCAPL